MKNIKLIIEYDGTNYAGWQRQRNGISIQQVVEEAIYRVTGESLSITGSGRTDSGVHARGQVANFRSDTTIPSERISYALNAVLPKDVKVLHSMEVPMDFHARFSAVGKHYRYSMIVNRHGTAIGPQYYHHVRQPLNIDAMKEAAGLFLGTHDFSAFKAANSSVKTTVRTIHAAEFDGHDSCLYFSVKGNGFLYNMVRIMVGTLLEVGMGKRVPSEIPWIIESGDRSRAGMTAPAQGLSLEEVYYPEPLMNLPEDLVAGE